MNAARLYRQNQTLSVPRIEVVLGLYDRLLDRLRKALASLESNPEESRNLAGQGCIALAGLSSAAIETGPDGAHFVRLYDFVLHCLTTCTAKSLRDAIDVLTPLRDSFHAVREQALELERSGAIPPLDTKGTLSLTA